MKKILPLLVLPSLCVAVLADAPPAPKAVDPQKVKVTATLVVRAKSTAARAAIVKPGELGRLAFNAVQADDVQAFVQLSVHGLSEKDTGLLLNSVVDQSLDLIKKDMAIRIELLGKIPEDKLKPNAKRALAEARQFLENPAGFKAKVLKEALARVEEKRTAVRVGFARLRATLAKRGIDLKQAKFLKVDTSDVRPALAGGGSPFESGDLDVVFTHKNRSYTLTIGNCANPPGFGWLAVDAPHFRDPSDPNDVASLPRLPTTLPPKAPTAGEGGSDGYDENWSTDLDAALAQAAKEKKLVYVDFTGSDWCPPCKALHRNVLVKKEFLDYAKKNLVLVVLDFPRRTKLPPELASANKALSKKYKVSGFPTIIVLDPEGKTLFRKSGYGGQKASAYVAGLKDKLGR